MTRKELNDELDRLAKGFIVTMTPEKADAYWQRFSYCRAADFREAITYCLTEPRYPTFEQIMKHLDHVSTTRHQQQKHQRDVEAKQTMQRLEQDAMNCPERQAFLDWLHGMRQANTGLSKPPLVYRCLRHDCDGNEDGCRQGSLCGAQAKWQEPQEVTR